MKLSPLAVGFVVAGLLLFGVVAIVRNVTTADIAPAVQNNVAAAISQPLPPPQPTAVQASWLAVQQFGAARYIWVGVWMPCQELTVAGDFVGRDVGKAALWQRLGQSIKADVVAICISEAYGQ